MLPRIFPLAFAIAAPRRAAACAPSLRLRRLTACAQRPPPPTDVDATAAPAKAPETPAEAAGFRIVREERLFSRYKSITDRVISHPSGKSVAYDVLSHGSIRSVFVFPLRADGRTVTMLREYCPGPHRLMLGFPAGFVEDEKHASVEDAARAELSEEARLKCGRLVPLAGPTGIAADKYASNQFHYYLALDCVEDSTPGPRDHDEWIEILHDVPVEDIGGIVRGGRVNTPHSLLATLALNYLDAQRSAKYK